MKNGHNKNPALLFSMKALSGSLCGLFLAASLFSPSVVWAQETSSTQNAVQGKSFKQEQLDQMLAPIALYPDSLLSQVLMASTYPADVAEAVKWSKAHPSLKGDEAVEAVEDQEWDPSVQSLAAFPQVLASMGEKPSWVQDLGDAFLDQPDEVMNSVQKLRAAAKSAGNLKSTEQQTVIVEQPAPSEPMVIRIEPANPQVVYVPVYSPRVVYGSWWWPHYPPVYLPAPVGYGYTVGSGIGFGVGIGITYALWGGFHWDQHSVYVNVNRYNRVYVNRPLNVSRNSVDWRHDPVHRRGVPYRDVRVQERYWNHRSPYRYGTGADFARIQARERAQASMGRHGIEDRSNRADGVGRARPSMQERPRDASHGVSREAEMPRRQDGVRRDNNAGFEGVGRDNMSRDHARGASQPTMQRDFSRERSAHDRPAPQVAPSGRHVTQMPRDVQPRREERPVMREGGWSAHAGQNDSPRQVPEPRRRQVPEQRNEAPQRHDSGDFANRGGGGSHGGGARH